MNQPNTSERIPARELFNQVMQYIATSRQAVERGELVELVMLEDKVRAMCESIQALSKQEMNRFADDLEHMHKELDALQGMLIKAREALRDELVGLDHHRKANVAYKASESLQGQPKTDGDEAAEEKA